MVLCAIRVAVVAGESTEVWLFVTSRQCAIHETVRPCSSARQSVPLPSTFQATAPREMRRIAFIVLGWATGTTKWRGYGKVDCSDHFRCLRHSNALRSISAAMWDLKSVSARLRALSAWSPLDAFCDVDGPTWPYTSRASLPIEAHHVLWIVACKGPLSEAAVMHHLLFAAAGTSDSLVWVVACWFARRHIETVTAPLLAQLHDQRLIRRNGSMWATTVRPITLYFRFERRPSASDAARPANVV